MGSGTGAREARRQRERARRRYSANAEETPGRHGCRAIADERTGGMHDSYNHACLAILRSVAEHGNLKAAEVAEARRLGITPKRASGDVRLIATNLYRAGLLQPAREGNARARP